MAESQAPDILDIFCKIQAHTIVSTPFSKMSRPEWFYSPCAQYFPIVNTKTCKAISERRGAFQQQ